MQQLEQTVWLQSKSEWETFEFPSPVVRTSRDMWRSPVWKRRWEEDHKIVSQFLNVSARVIHTEWGCIPLFTPPPTLNTSKVMCNTTVLPLATVVTMATHSSIIAGRTQKSKMFLFWAAVSIWTSCKSNGHDLNCIESDVSCYVRQAAGVWLLSVHANCILNDRWDKRWGVKKKKQRKACAWEFKKRNEAKNKHQPPHLFLFLYWVHHFWKTLFHTWSFFPLWLCKVMIYERITK